MHSYWFVGTDCFISGLFCFSSYIVADKRCVCCLLFFFVVVCLSCVEFQLKTVVCRCSSFLLVCCLYFQFANNDHVVRVSILSVVAFEVSFRTVTCSLVLVVCVFGLVCLLLIVCYY